MKMVERITHFVDFLVVGGKSFHQVIYIETMALRLCGRRFKPFDLARFPPSVGHSAIEKGRLASKVRHLLNCLDRLEGLACSVTPMVADHIAKAVLAAGAVDMAVSETVPPETLMRQHLPVSGGIIDPLKDPDCARWFSTPSKQLRPEAIAPTL